ncbi:MAG: hypothetical protein J7527_17700, partial [Chitinophagaceae bacterium]|nr:hypothetical protein [Chitinophagaceae bacterium]
MKQMEIPQELVIELDYDSPLTPKEVKQFRPVLFEEDDHYCCLLGPDLEYAVIGRGATEDEAIDQWVIDCKSRLESTNQDDKVLQYMKDIL